MRFFENTRKPQGFGGKLMTKMMNSGHAKLSQWGFSNISQVLENTKFIAGELSLIVSLVLYCPMSVYEL